MARAPIKTTPFGTRAADGWKDPPVYAVVLLTAIYAVNFLDRQILTVLAAPIKREFSLSNAELGLLSGFAFAAFYSVMGIPIARLADRGDRVRLLGVACLVWSVMTAACGAAQSFLHMFVARVLVGVGEAACVPASHSLISAWTRPADRPRALAIFALGIPIGTLLGLVLGGFVAQSLGWRAAFLFAALPGALLAVIALVALRDPSRSGRVFVKSADHGRPVFSGLARSPGFRNLCLGAAAASIGGYGLVAFLGVYMSERFNLNIATVGLGLGLAIGIGGGIGTFVGGRLASSRIATGRASLGPSAWGLVIAGAAILATVAATSAPLAFAGLFCVAGFNALWYGPVFAGVQGVAAEDARASAAAGLNLVVNLVGLGLGPPIIGFIADIAPSKYGLQLGLASAAIFNVWGALHLWRADAVLRVTHNYASKRELK